MIRPGAEPSADIRFRRERSARIMETAFGTTDEGFRIITGDAIEIVYASLSGLYFALISLARRINSGQLSADFFDYPRFSVRGVIEGYYGPPWSDEARRSMIRLLPEMRMNSFFYGPKNDPYHRELWREPYPPEMLGQIAVLQRLCSDQGSRFWYGIGPGLSMHYSLEDDRRKLLSKLQQLHSLGINHFGLYLDDIPETLLHADDIETFNDLAEAHISLINEVYRELTAMDPEIRLVVCPTRYWGEPGYYLARLSAEIDYRILIFHTGPEICSRELTLRDGAVMQQLTNRPVLYWDNYPVNDLEMSHRLHIGPYRGRDPHLYRVSAGIVANGMEYAEASKIPLMTIGDYLWNPESYEPEDSFRAAVRRIAGETDWEDFFPFADNNRASCLYPNDQSLFKQMIEFFGHAMHQGNEVRAVEILSEEYRRLSRAEALFQRGMENSLLEKEILPWREQFGRGVRFLGEVLNLLDAPAAERPGKFLDLEEAGSAFLSERWYVFSDVLSSFIREVIILFQGAVK